MQILWANSLLSLKLKIMKKFLTESPYELDSFIHIEEKNSTPSLVTIFPRSSNWGLIPIQIRFSELEKIYFKAKKELNTLNLTT